MPVVIVSNHLDGLKKKPWLKFFWKCGLICIDSPEPIPLKFRTSEAKNRRIQGDGRLIYSTRGLKRGKGSTAS